MKLSMIKKAELLLIIVIGIFAFAGVSHAMTKTWAAASAGNWNVNGNWTPSGIPGPSDTVIFNSTSIKNCALDNNADVNVAGFTIASTYTGVITQNSGEAIIVGSSGFSQAAGTFTGSSAGNDAINVNGPFVLTGGSFTSTNDLLELSSATDTFLASVFHHNSGTVQLDSTSGATITGSSTFYVIVFGNQDFTPGTNFTFTIATNTVLTVQNDLVMAPEAGYLKMLGGGSISAQGDVDGGNLTVSATGTASIVLNGSGTQTVGKDGGYGTELTLPNLTITKVTGGVTLANDIEIDGNWTNTNATMITPGTSHMTFNPGYAHNYTPTEDAKLTSAIVSGTSAFYDLELAQSDFNYFGNDFSFTIATGTTLTVQHDLMMSAEGGYIQLLGGGAINVQGNIDDGDQFTSPPSSSTASLVLTGTSTQLVGQDIGNGTDLFLPNFTVNKPSGVAYASGAFSILGTTTITQGEFDIATSSGATNVEFDGAVTIGSAGILSADPENVTSTMTLGSSVTNNGLVYFAGDGIGCALPLPSYAIINSTSGSTPRTWSGSGGYVMRYVSITAQTGPTSPVVHVLNGTSVGSHNSNWVFDTGARPQFVQSASSTSASATSTLVLPAFGFQPRRGDLIVVAVSAKNQSLAAPTDNAGNTYNLATSTTFGSSPTYAVGLYYANNINATSSFVVTVNGTSSLGSQLISGAAFEYTGMAPSSSFATASTNYSDPATTTAITSLSAAGTSLNALYFGATTFSANTTASSDPTWTARTGVTNNTTNQALYTEEIATTSVSTLAASWTAAASTTYGAVIGVFRTPYTVGYVVNGSVDSATFDTGVASGTQLNSLIWQGDKSNGTSVGFQVAVSNASSGPWNNFYGPNGTSNVTDVFSGNSGTPISLLSTANGYNLFNGYRYFRYRVILFADVSQSYSPMVSQVVVNWSP